jgi:hypothetical protein
MICLDGRICSYEHYSRAPESKRAPRTYSASWKPPGLSRKRAWENLQEIRWVLKDVAGIELPAPARKTIDLEGRIVKDGVRKTVKDRQLALDELLKAVSEFRKYTDQPLTLREGNYAHAVQALNKAIDRAQILLRC